ncbi:FtsX-like permease family protein [Cellulomonas dongxiuzhuiae]|uniref:ABC3 transporter permease C-terminal domain-containing protein n=1 Tax=Cellulomonas dongxiuzhuiae TaxID=2819979 RepID=A0ABX8GP07_9CELL|nr:FtsX-like permease family protein [Cellulomonas dongxiuzhuiae]MBO3096534.1 hypothetical protein [Cellulomonas dongxiuzhuiae]QWC16924.1 hypothetical protein KKR89_04675 [Cellulomonas dongxiuzhuiae]
MTTTATRVRATTGGALLVTGRRARLDVGLLIGTAILLTATLVAVLAAPLLLGRTAEVALRESITQAGADAAVVVVAPAPPYPADDALPLAGPQAEAAVLDLMRGMHPATAIAVTPPFAASTGDLKLDVRLVTLDSPASRTAGVRWTVGREPIAILPPPAPEPAADGTPPPPPAPSAQAVEVGLSVAVARALGIDPSAGPVTILLTPGRGEVPPMEAHVTGLYEPVAPDDVQWANAPDLLEAPTDPPRGPVGLYVPPAARADMAALLGATMLAGEAVAVVDVEHLKLADVPELRRSVMSLTSTSPVRTGLPRVLDAFDAHLSATLAQASLVVAGAGATAACCLVLAGALLVERRRSHLSGERARGASLLSVALRSAVESVPTAAVAALVAGGVVAWWLPDGPGSPGLATAITTVAVVAPVLLATRAAAAAWAGRRVPADRRERARLAGLRSARRSVTELTAVAVAVAALVTLRSRGLVPQGSMRTDPLLAAAPFLLALTAALVVVRVAPAVVRLAARWAARSRGLAAPLATSRAQRGATALLPLVTVTVAVALMVLSGVLVQTVHDGQRIAADQLVGADVRLDGALDTDEAREALARLAAADGVEALATGGQMNKRAFGRGSEPVVTVLVVDTVALAEVRRARGLPVDDGLALLTEVAQGRLPVLATPDVLARIDHADGTLLQLLTERVDVDVMATTVLTGDNGAPPADVRAAQATVTGDDGVVVIDTAAAARVTNRLPATTRAWVAGPGAVQAVADLEIADLPGVTVTTVDGWWSAWSRAPLPAALRTLMLVTVGVLAGLAVIALVLVVVATSGERGRTLSTLRTLGLDARTARWATLGELAPLVLGGFVGGTAIGLALPLLLGDALRLTWVTAAPGHVPVSLTWWPVLVAAGALAAALAVAVLVEQAVRRRERLGEVLRVGVR